MLSQSSLCLPAQIFLKCCCPVLLLVAFFKHNPALHPTTCSDVKLLIKHLRHSISQSRIRIISTSGDLCPYVQPFWNPPSIPSAPSLLARGKAKHLHCTCLCAHQSAPTGRSCVSGVAEFIILFCSFSLRSCTTKGEIVPKYNQEYFILYFILLASFPLHGGTFLSF